MEEERKIRSKRREFIVIGLGVHIMIHRAILREIAGSVDMTLTIINEATKERTESLVDLKFSETKSFPISEKAYDPYFDEKCYDRPYMEDIWANQRELNNSGYKQSWKGKQFVKQKHSRQINRSTYNHGKHKRKK